MRASTPSTPAHTYLHHHNTNQRPWMDLPFVCTHLFPWERTCCLCRFLPFFFKTAATNPPGGASSLDLFFTTHTHLFFFSDPKLRRTRSHTMHALFWVLVTLSSRESCVRVPAFFYLRRQRKNKTKSKGLEKGAPNKISRRSKCFLNASRCARQSVG